MHQELHTVDQVVQHLRAARSLLFITGAGISADSGLPVYRGIGGLYDVDDTEDGLPIEELLSGQMMQQRPELTWKYLAEIARACQDATFNRGHEVIAEMERHFPRVWTLTQNVDGFHRLAGSRNVIDIHGDLHQLLCPQCGWRTRVERPSELAIPPRCAECGAVVRPDVVLFGELLPPEKVAQLRDQLVEGFDMIFTIGTTSLFPYIAEPVVMASRRGIPTVEINPGSSEVSHLVTIRVRMRAAVALDQIWRCYQQQR